MHGNLPVQQGARPGQQPGVDDVNLRMQMCFQHMWVRGRFLGVYGVPQTMTSLFWVSIVVPYLWKLPNASHGLWIVFLGLRFRVSRM